MLMCRLRVGPVWLPVRVDGAVGSVADGLVEVDAEPGSPPLDGPLGEGLGRLDELGVGVGGSGQEGEPGPVADVFVGGFLETPVAVAVEVGPAPEGFGGLAMCAGGYVCGSAQALPGPTGLSCSVTASVIVFSWNAVSGADNYTAKLQLAVAGSAQTVRTTTSTSVTYAGLSSSTTYYIGVHSNVGGVAQYFSGVYCTTAVGLPSCGVVSGSGVQLYWRADSRVHQWYAGRVTTGNRYTDGRLLASSTLSTVFTGLKANVSYTFFFWWRASPTSAWNQVHPSAVCTTAAPSVTCTTTASTVSVSWGSVRGAVRYRVSRGSGWAAPAGLSHTFSNLSTSTAYTVRVQGWNSAGWGQTGTARCTTKAAILPAPTGLRCEATSSQIKFSWNPVAGADSYSAKIQLAQPGSAQTQMPTTSTSVTFTGLAASTKYWASVLAVKNNRAQRFAGVYCTTLADIAAPSLSCRATSDRVTVTWPSVTGASKYRARVNSGAWTDDLTATTHVFTGLAPAKMHAITVQSGGAQGWGNAANVRCVTAAAGVDCDDTTSNSVVVEWDPIDGARRWFAAISVGNRRIASKSVPQGNTAEFTGLAKATRYVVSLWWLGDRRKWNQLSPSPECWTKHLDTPKITGHTTGGNTLTIQWAPVEGAQRYQVKISPAGTSGATGASGQGWTTVVSTGTFHTFTGRTPGTLYTVQLRALDSGGNISATASSDRRASRVKCEAATASTITLTWNDPGDQFHWRVRRITGGNSNSDVKTIAKGAATTAKFTGLASNSKHSFAVERRVSSTDGWVPYAPFPLCHTAPSSPKIVQCPQAADVDGTIRWESNGAYYYRITLDHTQAKPKWIVTNSIAHTFTGLEEGKTYDVAVQAWNPQGWSEDSTCKNKMKTLPSIPDDLVTGSGKYYFTEGTVKGVLYAAGLAISNRNGSTSTEQVACGNPQTTVTKIQLAAIMLSIPPNEAYNAESRSAAPSPMTLSRWDNLGQYFQTHVYTVGGVEMKETKSLNIRLYSHMEKQRDVRAHWSPGVGPWQIDPFELAINLNHAERADTTKGGLAVAKFLLSSHCRDTTNDKGLRSVLNKRWHGCSPVRDIVVKDENGNDMEDDQGNKITKQMEMLDVCYNRYIIGDDKIYYGRQLNIEIVKQIGGIKLNQVDGGVSTRQCRWSSDHIPMQCHIYDTGNPQGAILNDDLKGTKTGMTPFPKAFISFTDPDTDIKYAVWPSQWPSSAHGLQWPTEIVSSVKTIYRAVMPDQYVRCSPGRDVTPESTNPKEAAADCAEETYKPFGVKIRNSSFDNGKHVVEGWFDDLVPFAEDQYHKLQLQNCGTLPGAQNDHILCWWDDI